MTHWVRPRSRWKVWIKSYRRQWPSRGRREPTLPSHSSPARSPASSIFNVETERIQNVDLLTLVKEEVVGAAQLISGVKTVGIEVAALSLSKTTIAIGTRQSVPFKEEKISPSYFKDRFQIFLTIADRWRRTRLGVFWFNETLERHRVQNIMIAGFNTTV